MTDDHTRNVSPDPAERRAFGRTGLTVTPICIGTSPLASMPALYGYAVGQDRAEATVEAVLDGPFNFLDTSNNYGGGSAELRIGAVLRRRGGIPDGFVLATKADPDPDSGDFSGERVRRSVEESLERLGVDHVPMMYLHDPEYHVTFEEAMAPGGPVEALVALRDAGVVGHLGVAGGPVELMRRFVGTGVFEAVINHNRWTLVNREAGPLLDEAVARGSPSSTGRRTAGACWSRARTPSLATPTGTPTSPSGKRSGRCSGCAPPTTCPWPPPRCSSRCATPG